MKLNFLYIFTFLIIFLSKESYSQAPTTINYITTNATCKVPFGKITITGVGGGVAPFTYSLNGGLYQLDTVFNNLAIGSNNILIVKGANGDSLVNPFIITIGKTSTLTTITPNAIAPSSCNALDGSITLTGGGTATPLTYSFGNNIPTTNNVFLNLGNGYYQILVRDTNACDTVLYVSISDPLGINSALTNVLPTACNAATGEINVDTTNIFWAGLPQILNSFQLNTLAPQINTNFLNLPSALYDVTINYGAGCLYKISGIYIGFETAYNNFTVSTISDTCFQGKGVIQIISNTAIAEVPCTFSFDNLNFNLNDTIVNQTAGIKTIFYKDNINGCTASLPVNVPSTDFPVVTITSKQDAICGLNNGSLITTTVGGVPPYTRLINNVISSTNLSPGLYTIIVTDKGGCKDTAFENILETNKITSIDLSKIDVICYVSKGAITVNSVTGGTAPYSYGFNLLLQGNDNSIDQLLAGIYAVTILDTNNCRYDTTIDLLQLGTPVCNITASAKQVARGETVTLTSTGNNVENIWSVVGQADVKNNPYKPAPEVTTTYKLNTVSIEGCKSECDITIIVLPKILIYKAFTPNGDGKNDTWEATNLDKYPEATIDIYSRWGMKVYSKKSGDSFKGFDGFFNGKVLPTGTYYYYIDLRQNGIAEDLNIYKGFIEIIE